MIRFMKYAIVSLGGKQHNVREGDKIEVLGGTVLEPEVLFYSDGKVVQLGNPTIEGFHLKLDVLEEKNSKKIQVKRYKAKSRYRKNKGHKQSILVLQVTELGEKPKKEEKETEAAKASLKAEKKPEAKSVSKAEKKTVKKVEKAPKTIKSTKKTVKSAKKASK